jgi:hypothetical protein
MVDLRLILGSPQQRPADSCNRQLRSPLLRAARSPAGARAVRFAVLSIPG